jgi:inner membrane protein
MSLLPDADVLSFRLGIPYESPWGHRGFTHSLTFAIFCGFFFTLFASKLKASKYQVFCWIFLATLSHSFLDALTNGGLGVAAFWPFSNERFFFPLRPIQVSPIGIGGFLSLRGLIVLGSEILVVWLPILLMTYFVRKKRGKNSWIE